MREETAKLDVLTKLHITKSDAFQILSIAAEADTGDVYHIPPNEAIFYFNDLESDAQYSQWPRNTGEVCLV